MTKKTRNWLIALSILAFPFVLFFGFLIFMEEPQPPVAPLPNPNGYDDFVKAGEMVAADTGNFDTMNKPELEKIVSSNTEALSLARAGLSNECRVPVQFSQAYLTNQAISDLIRLRKVAQAFVAEGKLAEKENRFEDAAQSYLDTIRLGNDSGRGGTLVDGMIGIGIDGVGTFNLQNISDKLDAKSCRENAAILESLITKSQSWPDIVQQENDWSRRTLGLHGQIMKLLHRAPREKNLKRAEDAVKSTQKKQRLLLIDLAARAYKLDKGKPPASLADLVPDYLKTVPQDPVTGTNMVYSP